MNLKRLRTQPPVGLKGRVPGDLHEALAAYADYYRSVHGEAIDLWSLVIHVLRTSLDADRAFQAWRRRAGGTAGGASAKPRHGTELE